MSSSAAVLEKVTFGGSSEGWIELHPVAPPRRVRLLRTPVSLEPSDETYERVAVVEYDVSDDDVI